VLADVPQVRQKLQTLVDVGLGYVHLGQSATTLSGGEAQRMKLARELSKRQTGRTLYLLDEPTTGLHFDDVRKLLEVLHRLVDLGNSVIIIEHNLDVIRNADWILDLGPEGGEDGGRVVGEGRPAKIAAIPGSYTGQFLTRYYASANGKLAPIDPDDPVDDCHPERAQRVEGPAFAGAPPLPSSSGERAGNHEPKSEKPKRARRNTPAEDDLASTRAKASRPASEATTPKTSGPRKKKTGRA
jgi:excinuclease ABC subunit A